MKNCHIFVLYDLHSLPGSYDFFGLNCYTSTLAANQELPVDNYDGDMGATQEQDPNWPKYDSHNNIKHASAIYRNYDFNGCKL